MSEEKQFQKCKDCEYYDNCVKTISGWACAHYWRKKAEKGKEVDE